jgi:hypothetical protein
MFWFIISHCMLILSHFLKCPFKRESTADCGGVFIPWWQRKESQANTVESDSWGFYCVLWTTFNKLSWYSVKGCGSPSKVLFGNRINKTRKIHLHSPRCSQTAERVRGCRVSASTPTGLWRTHLGQQLQTSMQNTGAWQNWAFYSYKLKRCRVPFWLLCQFRLPVFFPVSFFPISPPVPKNWPKSKHCE